MKKENSTHWKQYGKNDKDWLHSQEAKKAEYYFHKAIVMDPKNIDAHLQLGILYMKKGWFSSAEAEFLSILGSDKKNSKALLYLGVLYTKMDRYVLAENELLKAYSITPHEPLISKNLTLLYRFYLDRPDSAIVWANRYLNMDPQRDMDALFVRKELNALLMRYPEYPPYEPILWKKKQRFKPRKVRN